MEAVALLVIGALFACYANTRPNAPGCPRCRGISRSADEWAGARLITVLSATTLRECSRHPANCAALVLLPVPFGSSHVLCTEGPGEPPGRDKGVHGKSAGAG